jgi:4'-phosphopantetheinyl transferase
MQAAASQGFVRSAAQALKRCDVRPPGACEACVVVFDSGPWRRHGEDALALLDERERERAARFRHADDRDTYVLAHAMWRYALGRILGLAADLVPFAYTPNGQPILPGTAYATSLSHSGQHVAFGMTKAAAMGVDLERFPPRARLNDLVGVLCSPSEAADLAAIPADAREASLLQLWTRKEALLKAFGVGLSESLPGISVNTTDAISPPSSASHAPPCRVHSLQLPVELVGAWAAPVNISRCSLYVLDAPRPA